MNRTLRTVTIESLILPGDWRARLESENARHIAISGKVQSPPAIRKEDRSVIWGSDRLAAMHLRGDAEAEVWVIDCTEDEAIEMRAIENAFRRGPDLEARARLVAVYARVIRAEQDARNGTGELALSGEVIPGGPLPAPDLLGEQHGYLPGKRGRPVTPEGAARAKAAEALGVTKHALEVQASRERHRDDDPAPIDPPDATGLTPGLDVSLALDELDRLLMAAVKAITKLAKEHPAVVERFPVQQLKWKLQREVAPGFRAMRPQDRCPYCKLVASELPNCGACKGSGWIVADQLNDIPKELLATGEGAGIFVGGVFRTLKELAEAGTKKKTKGGTLPMGKGGSANATGTWPVQVPTERATRTVLEARDEDFSEAWTGGEE